MRAWLPGILVAALGGCGPPPHAPDVVLITIDTLRADHLGCYGYDPYGLPVSPSIDALADDSVLFESCFAPRGQTLPSLTSLMTGLYPSSHDVRENGLPLDGQITTVADALGRAGYETTALLAAFPGPLARSVARGFDHRRCPGAENNPRLYQDANDETVTRLAIEAIRSWGSPAARTRPFFLWIHLFDVHKPYAPRAPFAARFAPEALEGRTDPLSAWDRKVRPAIVEATRQARRLSRAEQARVVALYDAGVASADERVGRLLEALRAADSFRGAMIVLTADHGEELGDHHGYYFHGASVYDGVLHVPLLIKPPGSGHAARVAALAQNLDVGATILEAAGMLGPNLEGLSLRPFLSGAGTAHGRPMVYAEWQDLIEIVRTDKWKYIFNPRGAHPRKQPYDRWPGVGFPVSCEELYDLRTDPSETANRAAGEAAVVAAMREALERFRKRPLRRPAMTRGPGRDLPAELGYTGAPEDRSDVILDAEDCGRLSGHGGP